MKWESIKSFLKKIFNWKLLKETYQEWSHDKASRLAASLAYYTATTLGPLLIGTLAIVGFFASREDAQAQLVAQVRTYVGAQGAEVVETIVNNADQPDLARIAGIASLVMLLWSASNIFAQLQDSLDTIWGVKLRSDLPLMRKVQHRLLPIVTVLGIGILLLVALAASTALSAAGNLVTGLLPGGALIWQIVNFFISLAIITALFAVVFKVLPDVDIAWQDVWPGAALTAILFVVGQYALSWYLGSQSGSSVYGAAGSLIVLLLWLYYSSQIFLFGAEYTQVYATHYGEGVAPAKDAVARDEGARFKPAAQVASTGGKWLPQHAGVSATRHTMTPRPSSAQLQALPFNGLVSGLVDDGRRLFAQELLLVRTELQESVSRLGRSLAMVSGGGLLLYGGALFLLLSLPLLLWAVTTMSLPFALSLIGLLLIVYGWLISVWARNRLKHLTLVPQQTLESLREDGEAVKERLSS